MRFRRVLHEIRFGINAARLLDTFLSSLVVYLVFYILYSYVDITPKLAMVPALIYFVSASIMHLSKDAFAALETAYPKLEHRLITARDYARRVNPFVEELQDEVISMSRELSLTKLVRRRFVMLKVCTTIALCIFILTTTPYHFRLFSLQHTVDDTIHKRALPAMARLNITQKTNEIPLEWFGNMSLATLTKEEQLQMQMMESNYKLLSSVVRDAEAKEFSEEFPNDVATRRADSYKSGIAKENEEIVKTYFKDIATEAQK